MTLLTHEPSAPAWLTTVLRPAGELDAAAEHRLVAALEAAAAASDVVVLDVEAVGPLSRSLRRAVRRAHAALGAGGGALVLVDPASTHALTDADGERLPAGVVHPNVTS